MLILEDFYVCKTSGKSFWCSGDDFLEPAIRRECEKWVPNIDEVIPGDWVNAYLYVN